MASKRRIKRLCARKVAHVSREAAMKALKYGGEKYMYCDVYECPICGKWHVGHPKGYYKKTCMGNRG